MEVVKYFWSAERLQFGDQVEFRVTTRTYDQLVFATDISVAQRAKDIKFKVGMDWVVVGLKSSGRAIPITFI